LDHSAEHRSGPGSPPPAPGARAGRRVPGASSSTGRPWRWRALLPDRTARADRQPPDRLLLLVTLFLVGLGIVMIYSASAIRAQERFGDPTFFLKKQLISAAVGLLAMAWAAGRDLRTFQRMTPILILGSLLLLLLVLVPHVGLRINGARRWIRLSGLSFQPAELAKLAVILFLASYFARRQDRLDSFLDGFLPPLCMTGLTAGLVILQPNFGTASILLLVAGMLFFIGGARMRHLLATAAAALPVLVFLILRSPHGRMRLLALLDPARVSAKATYQLDQSFYALGPGGLLGRGLGDSMQKLFFLPEPHTDFIFAIVGEEMGFLGAMLVLLLFALFLWRGTRAAVRAGDPYASYLAMGITGLVVGQAALNIGVVSGLLPTTGVPLPFLSFGGSSLSLTLFGVGVLLSVSRGSAVRPYRHAAAGRDVIYRPRVGGDGSIGGMGRTHP
jgi:cell division protein FtsW